MYSVDVHLHILPATVWARGHLVLSCTIFTCL